MTAYPWNNAGNLETSKQQAGHPYQAEGDALFLCRAAAAYVFYSVKEWRNRPILTKHGA